MSSCLSQGFSVLPGNSLKIKILVGGGEQADGSAGKVLVVQSGGPEFRSLTRILKDRCNDTFL